MKELQTIAEIMKQLPEGFTVSKELLSNLATLSLAIDGMVEIIGFTEGQLQSINPPIGAKRAIHGFHEVHE